MANNVNMETHIGFQLISNRSDGQPPSLPPENKIN